MDSDISLTGNLTLASCTLNSHTAEDLARNKFTDEDAFYRESRPLFPAIYLLQTCGRIEILVPCEKSKLEIYLNECGKTGFVFYEGTDVLLHLGKLASGTQSVIIGEDQILGQLRTALISCEEHGASNPVISTCITEAIQLGVSVRQKTAINRGAVSMGSAAVQLAESVIGTLSGKNILVVGGGDTGRLVAKALAEKQVHAIYVTNRTYENAEKIANEIGGRAMHLDKLYPCIALSDVVISCTAAPHEIIRKTELESVMNTRQWPLDSAPKPLILIDIANPADIEPSCAEIPGITLYTLDTLKSVANKTLQKREQEAKQADAIVTAYLPEYIRSVNRTAAESLLASLYSWAETIRKREVEKAVRKLDSENADPGRILNEMSESLTKKLLEDTATAIKQTTETRTPTLAEKLISIITGKRR